jgi:hypothetical protein
MQTIIALHVLLLFTDSLPPLSIFFSIACHLVYLSNFTSSWPYISLSSPRFILSCVLVIADHFTWFYHFANKASEAKRRPKYRYGAGGGYGAGGQQTIVQEHSFMDVAAFFGICVWAIPLFLFLSLSANDNALPNSEYMLHHGGVGMLSGSRRVLWTSAGRGRVMLVIPCGETVDLDEGEISRC